MVRDFSQKTVQELYETIRVNVDEEEQWKVFDSKRESGGEWFKLY